MTWNFVQGHRLEVKTAEKSFMCVFFVYFSTDFLSYTYKNLVQVDNPWGDLQKHINFSDLDIGQNHRVD